MYYNDEFKYMLVDVPAISENLDNIVRLTNIGVDKFKRKFNQSNHHVRNDNITWQFMNYNVYCLCSCNQWFYDIFQTQINAIREYFKLSNISNEYIPLVNFSFK